MEHLNLWDTHNHDSLPQTPSHIAELTYDDSHGGWGTLTF